MRKVIKQYNLLHHTVELAMDNVCATPFFVVIVDGREVYAGPNRHAATEAFGIACHEASIDNANEKEAANESN